MTMVMMLLLLMMMMMMIVHICSYIVGAYKRKWGDGGTGGLGGKEMGGGWGTHVQYLLHYLDVSSLSRVFSCSSVALFSTIFQDLCFFKHDEHITIKIQLD